MLSTIDNPYNPHTDYYAWLAWDHDNAYFTNEYLARIANVSPDTEDVEIDKRIDAAMDEIIANDALGIYIII